MKFLFSIMGYFPDLVGGAWKYAAGLGEALAARGHEVTVLVPQASAELPLDEVLRGVRIIRLARPPGVTSFHRVWRADNHALRTYFRLPLYRPVHHGDQPPGLYVPRIPALDWTVARIGLSRTMVRGIPSGEKCCLPAIPQKLFLHGIARWMKAMEKNALMHAQNVLVASEYAAEKLSQTHQIKLNRIENIHAGTDYDHFDIPGPHRIREMRSRYGFEASHFVIASVRRLDRRMGLDLLIDGFARAWKQRPELRLIIAGKGPQADELAAKISTMGLDSVAKLAGFVSDTDLPVFYGAADLTVMPSLDLEGFGLSTIESLGCGTPVLVSSSGANPEVIGGLSPHLIFKTGDPVSLADKLISVRSGHVQLPVDIQCRDYALQFFHWNRSAKILEDFTQNQLIKHAENSGSQSPATA
ncbi:MAG: glycosyltransferase family 4 protein [Verrucomicrobia bacterium]|nr:glycosyltransferase family 4 protein [Verrucomicrobiota bacterium]